VISRIDMRPLFTQTQLVLLVLFSCVLTPVAATEMTKVMIYVTSSNKSLHQSAINNANALIQHYGKENIAVEIVANGAGVGIAHSKNSMSKKVSSLLGHGVRLSVCGTTLNRMKKSGNPIPLLDAAVHVSNGTVRAVELQKQGYSYLKP